MKLKIIENYLGFVSRLQSSERCIIKQLYSLSYKDCRTVTGTNLRNIMLLTDESSVDNLVPSLVNTLRYKELGDDELWKVPFAQELIELKENVELVPEGWSTVELDEILASICID